MGRNDIKDILNVIFFCYLVNYIITLVLQSDDTDTSELEQIEVDLKSIRTKLQNSFNKETAIVVNTMIVLQGN